LLFEGSSFDPDPLRVLIVEPVLDFDRLLPAARAIAAIRAAAQGLDPDESALRVRLTGNPVLNHEEMIGLAWDLGAASLLSLLLVSVVLQLAFRSWRIVAAAALTLLVGLVWTAAFAAAAIGELNVVSVAFAVLFVGLGVDFSIHLGAHYTAVRHEGQEHGEALRSAVGRVGGALALCTLTTAIGFYSFLPTDFRGVAELGLVAGSGMFVILFLTFTLFPILLGREPRLGEAGAWDPVRSLLVPLLGLSRRHPARVVAAAGVVALCAGLLAPRARFDANVVGMRDADTESVQAFETLLSRPDATPWSMDVLAPDDTTARELAAQIATLPGVRRAASLADYVPSDQPDKLALLEEASFMLYFPSRIRSRPCVSSTRCSTSRSSTPRRLSFAAPAAYAQHSRASSIARARSPIPRRPLRSWRRGFSASFLSSSAGSRRRWARGPSRWTTFRRISCGECALRTVRRGSRCWRRRIYRIPTSSTTSSTRSVPSRRRSPAYRSISSSSVGRRLARCVRRWSWQARRSRCSSWRCGGA
jgi:hypothetical protein